MPLTSAQRALVTQFIQTTGTSDKTAQKYLKNAGWKLNEAADAYFNTNPSVGSSSAERALDSMFSSLRDPENDANDKMELNSAMAYFEKTLNLDMSGLEAFVLQELVQAPALGVITREGFVNGWKAAGVPATASAQAQYIKQQTATLGTNLGRFKKVYKHVFVIGREENQRALDKDTALVYWSLLFKRPGMSWKSDNYDWVTLWTKFVEEKYTRTVSRDMWNMTLEFALKSMHNESLGFWSEDGAWPGVIDEFVEWFRTENPGDKMAVDGEN